MIAQKMLSRVIPPSDQASHVALLVALVAGILARFWGLGDWPLSTDEYFLTQSIFNIRAHGVPMFDCGGFYVRGLFQQYMTLPFIVFSSDVEWASRVPPAVFNVVGIPAVYLLGRRLGGSTVACAAAALYSLSIWEIEVARFARMYPFFQTAFLWHLVFLTKALIDENRSALGWMYAISAFSVFVYEGAIFLVCLNFIPFLTGVIRLNRKQVLINLALLVSVVVYRQIDFRHWGALSSLPVEMADAVGIGSSTIALPISTPLLLLTALPGSPFWLLAASVPLAISVWALARVWRTGCPMSVRLFWFAVIACLGLNQLGLSIYMTVLALVSRLISLESLRKTFGSCGKRIFVAILANLAYWIAFTAATTGWTQLLGEAANENYLQHLFGVLVDYPQVYSKVIYPWATAMPVMTASILLVVGGVAMALVLQRDTEKTLRLLVAILIGLIMAVAVLQTSYQKARYSFFLYPVMLLIICTAFHRLTSKIVKHGCVHTFIHWLFIGLLIVLSEDFGVRHLKHIASPEINFRTVYEPARQDLYFYRRDYSSPAHYVNQHAFFGDIVITPLIPALGFYLDRLDYVYINESRPFFQNYAACNGTREIWSNAALVHQEAAFFRLIAESSTPVWLVMYADNWRGDEERILSARYKDFRVYTSIDGTIDVFHIPPGVERASL